MKKTELSEQDIRTKFILPAIKGAGWDEQSQMREEYSFTDGKNKVRGYRNGTRSIETFQKLDYKLRDKEIEVDHIIKLFIPLTTWEAWQTVYAA